MMLTVPARVPRQGLGDSTDTTGLDVWGDNSPGGPIDTQLDPTSTPIYTIQSGSSTAANIAQIAAALGVAANAASSAYKSTQSPYVIPGTNVIANPGGTPVLGSSAGVTASQLSSSLLPIMGIVAVVAFVLILGKK